MFDLLVLIGLLWITYATGSTIEKRHYKKIKKRELELVSQPIVSFGATKFKTSRKIKKIELVTGEVVISGDYFKSFVANFKNFFGGRLTPYESILDRGRREAVLRMRESALGANIIINTRVEAVLMDNCQYKNDVPKCAMLAYGTAITYE